MIFRQLPVEKWNFSSHVAAGQKGLPKSETSQFQRKEIQSMERSMISILHPDPSDQLLQRKGKSELLLERHWEK